MSDVVVGIIVVSGTIIAYLIGRWIYKRVYTPLLLPVVVATFLIIGSLVLFNIPYETYMIGGEWINTLLGPAVVALAFPLYQNRDILKKLVIPMVVGTLVGAIVGVLSGVYLATLFNFDKSLILSLAPKSVTTPVAMDISQSLGGIASLAAAFVMVAGIFGAMASKYIYRLFRIKHPIGRGVGLGSASHAIGTAKALENSELDGSISTIAMILSAIFVSIIIPFMIHYLM